MRECNAKYDLEEIFREGVNRPIQGGASDLHSLAHIVTEANPKMREIFRIIDAVHDSCLAEVPAPDLATVLETAWMVKHLWQEIALNTVLVDGSKLGWQIPVEVSWGRNWGDMPYVLTARGGLLYRGQPVETDHTAALPVA
jgi:DNA polymerase I-like protein with 3'-5' exonuclease and polymerase domains